MPDTMISKVIPLPKSRARTLLREAERSMGRKCALVSAIRLPAEGLDLITFSVEATDIPITLGKKHRKMYEVRWALRTTRANNLSSAGGIVYSEIK